MKGLWLIAAVATLCFAATESRVSRANILAVENSVNEKFNARVVDSYDLLGLARGNLSGGLWNVVHV